MQQLLEAAGRGGHLLVVGVGQARGLHRVEVVADAGEQQRVVQHRPAHGADGQRRAGVGLAVHGDHRAGQPQQRGLPVQRVPGGAAHHAVHGQPGKALERAHGGLGGSAELPVDGNGGDAALVGAHDIQVILQLAHGSAAGAAPQRAGEVAGPQAGAEQLVGDAGIHLVQLVPGGTANHAVRGQAEISLEPPHRRRGARAKDAVHGQVAQRGVGGAGDLEPELRQLDVRAAVALPQRRAGVGVGGAVVGLDAAVLRVDGVPGGLPDHAVRGQPEPPLERAHGSLGARAEHAVHRHRRDGGVILRQHVQPVLQLLHGAAAGPDAQRGAVPGAAGQRTGGGLAFAGQFSQILDRNIDIRYLIPIQNNN